jgi:histidinol-phosphatase
VAVARRAAANPAVVAGPAGQRARPAGGRRGSLPIVSLDDDLALALALADAADTITVGRFGAVDLVVDTKPDLTPVSDADRAVEESLRHRLDDACPDDAVSGEEFGPAGESPRRWVIDPIDGTKNFVRGVPVWATLIGLLDGDDAVVGVVSAPALGRRWWASRGAGAWLTALGAEPRRLAVSRVASLTDASLSYASLAAWSATRDRFVRLTEQVWRTRAYGDFWSYMLVAEGAVDIAAEPELSLWDMAAVAPIVTEAGGRFTGLNGVDGVGQGNAAASNGLLHDALLAAVGGA